MKLSEEQLAHLILAFHEGVLTADEKSNIEIAKAEIGNLKKYTVVDNIGLPVLISINIPLGILLPQTIYLINC